MVCPTSPGIPAVTFRASQVRPFSLFPAAVTAVMSPGCCRWDVVPVTRHSRQELWRSSFCRQEAAGVSVVTVQVLAGQRMGCQEGGVGHEGGQTGAGVALSPVSCFSVTVLGDTGLFRTSSYLLLHCLGPSRCDRKTAAWSQTEGRAVLLLLGHFHPTPDSWGGRPEGQLWSGLLLGGPLWMLSMCSAPRCPRPSPTCSAAGRGHMEGVGGIAALGPLAPSLFGQWEPPARH